MAKRRANGEGSIYQRKDGTWTAQYTDAAGKKRYLYGKTQQIVKDKLKEAIRQTDQGLWADANRIKFVDWLKDWLEVYERPKVQEKTYSLMYNAVYKHIAPAFPRVLLKDLRPEMIQKFINEKAVGGRLDGRPGGIAARTLEIYKRAFNGALTQAVDNNLILSNPAKKVSLPKIPYKEKQILTREQQRKLEQAALEHDNPLMFMIFLGLYSGMRVGEMIGLKIDDIDFEKEEIHVRRTIGRANLPGTGKGKRVISEPKTAKGRRTIPMPDFLADRLKQYIEDRNALVEAVDGNWREYAPRGVRPGVSFEGWKDEGYVFLSAWGKPPEYGTVYSLFNKLLDKLEIPRVTIHALRHTFATRAIEAGFDVKSLSEILGHTDATVTLNTYTHALEEQKRQNMNKLNDLFCGSKEEQKEVTGTRQ